MAAPAVRADEMRQRYLREAVITATPATRLNMLFDRLVMDLRLADDGFERNDLKAVSDGLCNAQEILLALRGTLRVDLWDAARDLSQLYFALYRELLEANLHKDRGQAREVLTVVEELAHAWRRAADLETTSPPARTAGAPV